MNMIANSVLAILVGYLNFVVFAEALNPAALYKFNYENCKSGFFPDDSGQPIKLFGDLRRFDPSDKVKIWSISDCVEPGGSGISSHKIGWQIPRMYGMVAAQNSTGLIKELSNATSFSVELWFDDESSEEGYDLYTVLMSISTFEPLESNYFACKGASNLELLRHISGLYVLILRYKNTVDGFGMECSESYSNIKLPRSGKGPQHLIINVDYSKVTPPHYIASVHWSYNGGNYVEGGYTDVSYIRFVNKIDESVWENTYHLQLLSDTRTVLNQIHINGVWRKKPEGGYLGPGQYGPFNGTVFMFAFYTRMLTGIEAKKNYLTKFPDSPPVVKSTTVKMYEDGMNSFYFNDTDHYAQDVPLTELSPIRINIYDYESDPNNIYTFNPKVPPVRAYLAEFPNFGTLYDCNYREIFPNSTEICNFTVYYRPPTNAFSIPPLFKFGQLIKEEAPYTWFKVYAEDARHQRSLTNGTVTIFVSSKNDPPTSNNTTQEVYDGYHAKVCTTGSDVEDIYIDKVMIASVPQKGKLFSIPLGGVPSKPISAGSSMGFRSQCIHYVYEGDKKGDENGQVDTDSFLFYVKDSEGFCSKNYTMDISIKSPIITGNEIFKDGGLKEKFYYEDTENRVQLYGYDIHKKNGISFVITEIPTDGVLIDPVSKQMLSVGDSIESSISAPRYSDEVYVIYKPKKYFTSIPTMTWNNVAFETKKDSFSYQAVKENDPTYRGVPRKEELTVMNVNDPTTMICPQTTSILNSTKRLADNEDFDTLYSDRAFIRGIYLEDPDLGVDAVRVSVTSYYGVLSLHPNGRNLVNFFDSRVCFEEWDWQCKGDGFNDMNMTFVATPSDALLALNGLRYQTKVPGITDTVTITIYDGSGGNLGQQCIAESFFKSKSYRKGCYTTTCTFTMISTEYKSEKLDGDKVLLANVSIEANGNVDSPTPSSTIRPLLQGIMSENVKEHMPSVLMMIPPKAQPLPIVKTQEPFQNPPFLLISGAKNMASPELPTNPVTDVANSPTEIPSLVASKLPNSSYVKELSELQNSGPDGLFYGMISEFESEKKGKSKSEGGMPKIVMIVGGSCLIIAIGVVYSRTKMNTKKVDTLVKDELSPEQPISDVTEFEIVMKSSELKKNDEEELKALAEGLEFSRKNSDDSQEFDLGISAGAQKAVTHDN